MDPSLEFYGMGGSLMEEAGVWLIKRIGESSVVGIQEAIAHVPKLLREFRAIYHQALEADAVIMVDYPGYHLFLAQRLLRARKRIFYYVLPQIWAWGRFRASILRRMEGLYSILPFEVDFFRRLGMEVKYFGHPLASLRKRPISPVEKKGRPTIGFLPGSRRDEIRRMIPRMMAIKARIEEKYPDAYFYMSLLDSSHRIPEAHNLEVRHGESLEIIKGSDVVVVASGTASLEAAVLGTPAVVLYAVSEITWLLARSFARVKWVSLPNLILGQEVFPEFIQHIHPQEVVEELSRLLERSDEVKDRLAVIRSMLGDGNAVEKVARDLISNL